MHYIILFLNYFEQTYIYQFLLLYVGLYPMFGCIVWITCASLYALRFEKGPAHTYDKNTTYLPSVSIIISAFNEEKYIKYAVESLLEIDYPNYEIIVVDDCSRDNTNAILSQYADLGKIRLITKSINEGKAMALNDAAPLSHGEIIFSIDADSEVEPDILHQMVRHFKNARVGAVAGNPRVKNLTNFLTRMQFLEYTSIIGMIRRSQRIWGRIMAFSGVVFAVRKTAFYDVGGFSPAMATEDIDLTWKLQMRFWDVFYEVNAVVWVVAPET
jgi:biofilm PGA synthesis N-glycosyltransferase PgaC